MSLDSSVGGNLVQALNKWSATAPSQMLDHERVCCAAARAWLNCMDTSLLGTGSALSGPQWITDQYKWGPTQWPLYWCEAIHRATLDCGALSIFAQAVFQSRGVTSFPVQVVELYTPDVTSHWLRRWERDRISSTWIRDELTYHEVCAVVLSGNALRVWDATKGRWIPGEQSGGYGSIVAIRVTTPAGFTPATLRWGEQEIPANTWHNLGNMPTHVCAGDPTGHPAHGARD